MFAVWQIMKNSSFLDDIVQNLPPFFEVTYGNSINLYNGLLMVILACQCRWKVMGQLVLGLAFVTSDVVHFLVLGSICGLSFCLYFWWPRGGHRGILE